MLPGKWKDWEITEDIGSGSYGTVYQIEHEEEIKAVKIIEIPQKDEYSLIMKEHGQDAEAYCRSIAQDFEAEINTLMLLRDCENVIHIDDYVIEKKQDDIGWTIYIFMDCLISFTEYALMHEMNESEIIRLSMEISNALIACEKQGIIHRDLKPENILVTDEGKYLLCDFGLARKLGYKQQVNSVKGTYKYMAPEVYHGTNYNHTIDIYSLGLIVYQYMNQRRGVFIPLDTKTVLFKDEEKALQMRMNDEPVPPPSEASPEFADIILRMIAYDSADRYQSAQILYNDLVRLKAGKYHKKTSFSLRHYKKTIIAASLFLLSSIAYFGWCKTPIVKEAPCGDHAVATLTNDGTLTITGTGAVDNGDIWQDHSQEIKKIVIKGDITDVDPEGNGIFADCPNLSAVRFPKTLQTIGINAFAEDKKLDQIDMPDSLVLIGEDAFYHTAWEKKRVDENGFLIIHHILAGYQGDGSVVTIPDTVKYICGSAFFSHPEITEVVIPDTVEYIGQEAFADCENLETITFGHGIQEIGPDAFADTPWQNGQEWAVADGILLKYNGTKEEIIIPEEVTVVGIGAFAGNTYIKKVTIPAHVEMVWQSAFEGCDHLEQADIAAPLKDIEYCTFKDCTSLSEVRLPDSLENIQSLAFLNCVRLKQVRIPEKTVLLDTYYGEDTGGPFYDCKVEIIRYP